MTEFAELIVAAHSAKVTHEAAMEAAHAAVRAQQEADVAYQGARTRLYTAVDAEVARSPWEDTADREAPR